MTEHKRFPITEFKAVDGEPEGTFTALVSVFKNVDLEGDVVFPGAFKKSIAEFREQGKKIPVLYSHGRGLDDWIGEVDPLDAVETHEGLVVKGRLDMDDRHGRKVHKLMDRRVLTEFSFAYEVRRGVRNQHGGRDLHELGIIEIGPTMRGANPSTELLAVKSDTDSDLLDRLLALKSDRSPAVEALTSARRAVGIDGVIDAALGRRGTAQPVAPGLLTDAINSARQDVSTDALIARIQGRTSTSVQEALPEPKSAPAAPPTSGDLDARIRSMQRPAGDPNFAAGAVLGGVLGAGRAPIVAGRTLITGSMTPVDLDANLAQVQAEAERTALAAKVAAEQLTKAQAAVEAYDRQREDRDGSPDAAA